jgi:Uma2 family endonuclease
MAKAEFGIVFLNLRKQFMKQAISDKIFSVEEYIQYEWTSERPHEFINGQLFEMPGEKDINNEIATELLIILRSFLKEKGYTIYTHDMKVKIHEENKYYYPDLFATKEAKTESNKYIKYEPEIITEVVSESSQVTDYVDKYIDYTKIPTLQYYMIVEPETILITVYERVEANEWITRKYTKKTDFVQLEKMDVSFPLQDVYK